MVHFLLIPHNYLFYYFYFINFIKQSFFYKKTFIFLSLNFAKILGFFSIYSFGKLMQNTGMQYLYPEKKKKKNFFFFSIKKIENA